jgi:hypothetical protein
LSVGSTPIKLLLVDDEPAQMELIKLNIEETDKAIKVISAATPKGALVILEKE